MDQNVLNWRMEEWDREPIDLVMTKIPLIVDDQLQETTSQSTH